MNFDTVSNKHLQDMERLSGELLAVMRQAKLFGEPLAQTLRDFQTQLSDERRARYDMAERDYKHS